MKGWTVAFSRRDLLKQGGAAALLGASLSVQAQDENGKAAAKTTHDPALHLLNRLTWGPRPEEVARVEALGLEGFLDEQLNPETLDDAEVDALLANLPILEMDRKTLFSLQNPEKRAERALVNGMLARAVVSKRQLQERMVEFWLDHFNVPTDFDNIPNIVLLHQDVRKHALGNFRTLLSASAKSPAMLFYLDNRANRKKSPNENYARELLELHTVGVDGGYSEQDVKAVARAFTGWTIHDTTESGFWFNEGQHDKEPKQVLGHALPADRGIEDGLHVLNLLANHPHTAQFICHKLCVRFVSDDPPPMLVARLAQVWQEARGEIKPVLRALFTSEEFRQAEGQKLRRPLDFFVGALRATGTEVTRWWTLREMLEDLGQPPYEWHPPDGYPDVAAAWLSTGGILARWNVAMRLTHGAHSDPEWTWGLASSLAERNHDAGTVGELTQQVSRQVFGRALSNEAAQPFIEYAADGAGADEPVTPHLLGRKLASLYGLMLTSPQYQWR